MRADVTSDPTAFVSRDWTALVGADPAGTFFHTPAYLKLWWEGGQVLAAKVDDGMCTEHEALEIAKMLLYENAARFFSWRK